MTTMLICGRGHPMTRTTIGALTMDRCEVPRCESWRITRDGHEPVDGRNRHAFEAELARHAKEPTLEADCVLLAGIARTFRTDPLAAAGLSRQAQLRQSYG
jgi:hypothetical protein